MQLEKVYEPHRFESHWAKRWVESGIYHADPQSPGSRFSLVIPPPNVTGVLHVGHMLEHTEIDVTVRWHRMRGDNTLWLPGTDHAGIATQMVVERQLASEGTDRITVGRVEFERRVWAWKEESGGTIRSQMIRLGESCDWSRERFTLDSGLARAVRETFVRLYEKGLIYRGGYMVNWCPRCHTALSDLEVVHEETLGSLWHIAYPVTGATDGLVVATTRPETMLGDTAVAVNPHDERYTHLHGKTVRLPLMDREIPIVLDDIADPKFGTGVVKITPAHDPNDLETGLRHNLPRIQVIDENGKMSAVAGSYSGLDRFEARKQIVADLQVQGYLVKIEPHALSVGQCQRCKTVVEPLISTQWFVKTKPLAEPAIRAVEDGRIQFVPESWSKTYFEWMYNIRDWCISRQLWWGHRIPAWHCGTCHHINVARDTPAACSNCGSAELIQDPDVLDTWFSSGLWPFSTLGWPDQTADLGAYYPTTLLITGFDILFFWVARMIMLGIECMGDVPFRQVYIHGLVRDADKQKMSKTKGNVIDPLEITEKYGTDAVRLALLQGAAPGTDIVLTGERMESSRAFANKVWNASRFIFSNMERSGVEPWIPDALDPLRPEAEAKSLQPPLEDRWIFSRLNQTADLVNRAVEQFRYHEAAQVLWHFIWHEFCDWYIEVKKLRFEENSGANAHWRNLLRVYEAMLRLLHPVMPFLTEELWQRLSPPGQEQFRSISLAPFPQYDQSSTDPGAERDIELMQAMITAVRELRSDLKVNAKEMMDAALLPHDAVRNLAGEFLPVIEKIARVRLELLPIGGSVEGVKRSAPEFDLVARVSATQSEAQRGRVIKEIEQLEKVVANSERQLADDKFIGRAPAHVIDSLRAKLADYQAQLEKHRSSSGRLIDDPGVRAVVQLALREDIGTGDVTSAACVPAEVRANGRYYAREAAVLAGIDLIPLVYKMRGGVEAVRLLAKDGDRVTDGQMIAEVVGSARTLLECERVSLNFLQRLSGIATLAQKYAERVAGTECRVLDTRKTTPGLRQLEKHAAAAGGVTNHRMGLYDAILIKNNHIAAAGGVRAALAQVSSAKPPVEIEVRTRAELSEALEAGAGRVLLDNLTPEQAVEEIRWIDGRASVELSGNINLETIRAYAETGADFVSCGAITHSAPAADFNFRIELIAEKLTSEAAGACSDELPPT